MGFQLKNDTCDEFIDENHFRQPNFPTEAIFRAVKLCSPQFSFAKVDFVTDRNNLRKLLNFVKLKADRPFVIRINRRGSTIILTRVETSDRGESMGYGHSFEKKVARNPIPHSSSFRRIVEFNLGELTLVVRTEVDGAENDKKTEEDELVSHLTNLSLQENWQNFENSNLQFRHEPPHSTQRKVLDFKTKNSRFAHEFDWEDTYLQMILGGVHSIVIGWHNCGKFEKIDEYSESDMKKKISTCSRVAQ